jgi:hypothetical protein
MFKRVGLWLDAYMTRNKKKLLLVDFYGDVILVRYTPFHHEETMQSIVTTSKRPAPYVHHFLKLESPDGPSKHSHVGTTFSFIFNGGYRESYKGRVIHRKRFSINVVRWPEVHKILDVDPNTWTLFVRWFPKSDDVRIVPDTCETVCQYCEDRYGHCFNENKEFKYSTYSTQFKPEHTGGMKYPTWMHAGPETDAIRARRKRVVARMKLTVPVTAQDQLNVGQKYSKLPEMYDRGQA